MQFSIQASSGMGKIRVSTFSSKLQVFSWDFIRFSIPPFNKTDYNKNFLSLFAVISHILVFFTSLDASVNPANPDTPDIRLFHAWLCHAPCQLIIVHCRKWNCKECFCHLKVPQIASILQILAHFFLNSYEYTNSYEYFFRKPCISHINSFKAETIQKLHPNRREYMATWGRAVVGCIARWPLTWPPGDTANHSSPPSDPTPSPQSGLNE